MCILSGVFTGARTVPLDTWTPDTWSQVNQILDAIRRLDAKLEQPDCEDPAKAAWMQEVEQRLLRLEAYDHVHGNPYTVPHNCYPNTTTLTYTVNY